MKLHGRNAIITGAGQGLGASIAEHYVAEGASVLLCARDETSLRAVQDRLMALLPMAKQRVLVQKTDVGDPAQVDSLVAHGLEQFERIDILVNNAGVYGPFGPIEAIAWDEWVDAIRINLLGAVYGCRALLPHFKRQHYGKIICLLGGGATNPLPGSVPTRLPRPLACVLRDPGPGNALRDRCERRGAGGPGHAAHRSTARRRS